jgi:hypothetical protein
MDDKLTRYRAAIRKVLREYAALGRPEPGQRVELIEDPVNDHFELIRVGWDRRRRVHYAVMHLDIIDGKVWIEHDATDRPLAEELVAAGVPKEDIVLGYKLPDIRPHTGYAVG